MTRLRNAMIAVVSRHTAMMLSVTIRIVVIDNPKILSMSRSLAFSYQLSARSWASDGLSRSKSTSRLTS
jgi:hypothetical protein